MNFHKMAQDIAETPTVPPAFWRGFLIMLFLSVFFWGPLIWLAAKAIDRGL